MIKDAIAKVITGTDLNEDEMVAAMDEIMGGEATPAQIGSFITALRMKGETVEEISGAAKVMRQKATKIKTHIDLASGEVLMDTCGTGGDGSGTFNVSTASAFVIAGVGIPVAKHGNRSVSSHCGSADVLEALGVNLNMDADSVGECIREVGIGFLFAPMLHGAMKHAIGPRREIGARTIFNVLGPLTNPAGANVQVMGVYSEDLCEKLASVLTKLGSKRAMVVWGEGNLDELTVTGQTTVAELKNGAVSLYKIKPEDVGLNRAVISDLAGGKNADDSAVQLREILQGKAGACLDMVLLNGGAGLMVAEKVPDIKAGIEMARQVIDSGAAAAKLDALIAFGK